MIKNTKFVQLCAAALLTALIAVPLSAAPVAFAASTPYVASNFSTQNSPTVATIYGTVNPNELPTQAWFEYGLSESFGSQTAPQSISGIYPIDTSATLSNLQPNTAYYWRAVAQNSLGRVNGPTKNFITTGSFNYQNPSQQCPGYPNLFYPNCPTYPYNPNPIGPVGVPPTVTTQAVVNRSDTSVTFSGLVNPNGVPTNAWFEYGTSATGLVRLPSRDIGSGYGQAPRTTQVLALRAGTTYFYRVVAQNIYGISYGSILKTSTTGTASTPIITPDPTPTTQPTSTTPVTPAPTSTPGTGSTAGPVIIATPEFDEDSVSGGKEVKYTLTVKNSGTVAANNVSVTLTLPNELSYVESDPKISSRNGAQHIFALGTIDANDEEKLEVTLEASDSLTEETIVQVAASIDYTDASNRRQVVTTSRTVKVSEESDSFFANIGSAFGRLGNIPGYLWFFIFLLVMIIAVTWLFFNKLRGTEPSHDEHGGGHDEHGGDAHH